MDYYDDGSGEQLSPAEIECSKRHMAWLFICIIVGALLSCGVYQLFCG